MRCPFCGFNDTAVKDSRTSDDHATIKRRRFCGECGARFTTLERVQLRDFMVIKQDGTKVPFDRDKMHRSIAMALRKRPVDQQKIERIVNSLVRKLETTAENEITTKMIGDLILESLQDMDPVAYIRFTSVYKKFEQVDDFIALVQSFQNKNI